MWARIENGAVAETTDIDPAGRFHTSFVWVACPSEVVPGWACDGESFTAPVVSLDDLVAAERGWRNDQVSSTEWLVTRHRDEQDMQLPTTLQVEQFAELQLYRQALRDWPQSPDFPASQKRPETPPWVAEQDQ